MHMYKFKKRNEQCNLNSMIENEIPTQPWVRANQQMMKQI